MDKRGSMFIGVLFVVAFVALISVPVMQVVSAEQKNSIGQQLNVKAQYYAEAGLMWGQAKIREVGLPLVPQTVSMGEAGQCFEVKATEVQVAEGVSVHYLTARGTVGEKTRTLKMLVLGSTLRLGALTLTGLDQDLYLPGANMALNIKGNIWSNGGLRSNDKDNPAAMTVDGSILLAGELRDWDEGVKGKLTYKDTAEISPFGTEGLEAWAQDQIPAGAPLSFEQVAAYFGNTNVWNLTEAAPLYWSTSEADKTAMQVIELLGPTEAGKSVTLVVDGPLYFKTISGNINLIVLGMDSSGNSIVQETGGHVNQAIFDVNGIIYCPGRLTADEVDVTGAVVAGALTLNNNAKESYISWDDAIVSELLPQEEEKLYYVCQDYSESSWNP